MNYNTVIKYISCVCTLEHTTTHVEARGWLTRTSSQPLMSSGKQTQASKQLAPLPTELSSAQKSLGAWCLTGAESWGLPCVGRFVASLPRKISLFQRVANKLVGWGAKPPPRPGNPHLIVTLVQMQSRPPQEANRESTWNIPDITVLRQTVPSPHSNQDPCSRAGLQRKNWHRPSA